MASLLSDSQWQEYEQEGYLRLGQVLSDADVAALRDRIDEIMMGRADVPYERMLMQLLDPYTHAITASGKGFHGASLSYRKIQDLEFDPLFLSYMQRPIFREVCARVYGESTPIAAFRAMFMNKPTGSETTIGWHQDRWTHLDRDPLVTIWTALDPATVANGCVQIIPRSHQFGLINPSNTSGYITEEQAHQYAPESEAIDLEVAAGEAVLLHNWLLHRSGKNIADTPRRAFSVCYMDAGTKANTGEQYSVIFGLDALTVENPGAPLRPFAAR